MSHLDDNLAAGEVIRYRTRLHWVAVLGPLALGLVFAAAALGLLIVAVTRSGAANAPAFGYGALACAVIAAIAFVTGAMRRSSTEMAVTNRRVLMKTGLVSRKTTELMLGKIESIGVNQGVLGRMAGYGSVTVRGTGGTYELFDRVSNPLEFRRQVQEQIDQQGLPPPGPISSPAPR